MSLGKSTGALVAAIMWVAVVGLSPAFGDCCQCTTPFGNGMFCGPTGSVPCDLSNTDVQCPGTTVVGGTCTGGTDPGGTGIGGVCNAATAAPQASPALSPIALVGLMAGLGIAGVGIARRTRSRA